MRKISTLTCLIFLSLNCFPWGFWAHKRINRMAVINLPDEMASFYKRNINYITERAVTADKRRYLIKDEAPRHYIDIDHYGKDPFKAMPKKWDDAVKKYTADTLKAYGIAPWHIQVVMAKLTNAFKEKDSLAILKLSADLGHYIADIHVPLHTTENYNGQLTGQHGIHGFWESRLPELFGEAYDLIPIKAIYIRNPLNKAWEIVEQSNTSLDSVLSFEKKLNASFPADRKYGYEKKGKKAKKEYSREYSEAYHQLMNGMVERRMREAIGMVSCFWYTAWVNAGQPELKNFKPPVKEVKEKLPTKGEMIGRKE